jgi:hypothetical protein
VTPASSPGRHSPPPSPPPPHGRRHLLRHQRPTSLLPSLLPHPLPPFLSSLPLPYYHAQSPLSRARRRRCLPPLLASSLRQARHCLRQPPRSASPRRRPPGLTLTLDLGGRARRRCPLVSLRRHPPLGSLPGVGWWGPASLASPPCRRRRPSSSFVRGPWVRCALARRNPDLGPADGRVSWRGSAPWIRPSPALAGAVPAVGAAACRRGLGGGDARPAAAPFLLVGWPLPPTHTPCSATGATLPVVATWRRPSLTPEDPVRDHPSRQAVLRSCWPPSRHPTATPAPPRLCVPFEPPPRRTR